MVKRVLFFIMPLLVMASCGRQPLRVLKVDTALLSVDSTLDNVQDSAYIAYLEPIREEMESQLSVVLGVAPEALGVYQPESPMLNWSSDALHAMAEKVTGERVDVAVVNRGGLRCEWQAGNITRRSVYELMPFDNELVILTLTGEDMLLLAKNCVEQGGQGVSATMRVRGKNGQAVSVTLNGKEIVKEAYYYVATSDYLSGGADGLTALTHFVDRKMTGKKIRDLYMDYVQQQGVVTAKIDGRMAVD